MRQRSTAEHGHGSSASWAGIAASHFEALEPRVLLAALDLATVSGVGFDFNHDGNSDVVTWEPPTGNLTVDLMNATGNPIGPADHLGTFFIGQNTHANWQLGGAGNWQGGGASDLLWLDTDTHQLQIWLMNDLQSTGTTMALGPIVSSTMRIGGVADFDGNGTDDIVWQDTSDGDITIWEMNGMQVEQAISIGQDAVAADRLAAAGDLNGNGQADLLWNNTATGAVYGWLENPADLTRHTQVAIGNLSDPADPTHHYSLGGVTYLNDGATSNILVRANDDINDAPLVDWKLDATLQVTKRTFYDRAPIRQSFITADRIAGLPLDTSNFVSSLVSISDDPNLSWRTFTVDGVTQSYVQLSTWTNYLYTGKETSVPAGRYLWSSADYEFQNWYSTHDVAWDDLQQRTAQLMGMPADTYKTHFMEFWVVPRQTQDDSLHAAVWRPTPLADINDTTSTSESGLPPPEDLPDPSYRAWYDNQKTISYVDPSPGLWNGGYPWTRMGYTYDWGDPTSDIGLSEFIVPEGTSIILNDSIPNEVYWGRIYGVVDHAVAGAPVTYTDSDGDIVTVSLKGAGDAEVVLPEGGVGDAIAIDVTGSTRKSALSVTVRKAGGGNGRTTVEDFKVGTFADHADIDSIKAPTTALGDGGEIAINGAIRKLTLYSVATSDLTTKAQHLLAIGGSVANTPVRLSLGTVTDLTLRSDTPIARLTAGEWDDLNSTADSIAAPYIDVIRVRSAGAGQLGNFACNITLSGSDAYGSALNELLVSGQIVRSNIMVADTNADGKRDGGVGSITAAQWTAGSVKANWVHTLIVMGNKQLAGNLGASIDLDGGQLSWTSHVLNRVHIAGDWTSRVTVTGTVDLFQVVGTADGAQLLASGNLRTVSLGASDGSDFVAGANLANFPVGKRFAVLAADFSTPAAKLKVFEIKGWHVSSRQPVPRLISDTNLTAPNFGTSALRNPLGDDAFTFHVLDSSNNLRQVQVRDKAYPVNNWNWKPGRTWPGPTPLDVILV